MRAIFRLFKFCTAVGILMLSRQSVFAQAQLEPTGLLFIRSNMDVNVDRAIYLLDPANLQYSVFTSKIVFTPKKWSPSGQTLVGTTYVEGGVRFCLVNRYGQSPRCMQDFSRDDYLREKSDFTWSSDETKVYFIVLPGDDTWRFIEADANTGKTLRILVNHTITTWKQYNRFTWTPDLNRLLLYADLITGYEDAYSAEIIEIPPNTFTTPTLIRRLGKAETLVTSPSVESAAIYNATTTFRICPFSPNGKYFIGVQVPDMPESSIQFYLLFDNQGRLVKQIEFAQLPNRKCPQWDLTGDSFYFSEWVWDHTQMRLTKTWIYRHFIVTNKTQLVYSGQDTMASDFYPSPDGSMFAFYFPYGAYPHFIGISYPDNSTKYYSQEGYRDYYSGLVWIPPLATIPVPPNIILPPAQPTLINPLPGGGGE
jgi:hypothetical protein